MNYKFDGLIKKNKIVFIIAGILWLLIAIVLIMPFTCASYAAKMQGGFNSDIFIKIFITAISNIKDGYKTMLKYKIFGKYLRNLGGVTIVYLLMVIYGVIRNMPKHQYDGTEHGSSDWSEHGSQYQILNKKEGIILAENNYLPVDKRGNVNVLVVGRIRFW